MGGLVMAYHFKECDIVGNMCIYYGFLPAMSLRLRPRICHITNAYEPTVIIDDSGDPDVGNVSEKVQIVDSELGGHSLCRLNTQRVWPRHMYLRIIKECACSCSEQCVRVSVLTRDDVLGPTKLVKLIKPKNTYCIRQIPWEDTYLMMGSNNDSVVESLIKENRLCKSCRKCSNSPVFCREHKICRHKKSAVAERLVNATSDHIPQVKKCKRII